MYESPIRIIQGQMETKIEDDIFQAIQHYGVDVDKDALVSALMYDRHQYEKGYQDAKEEYKDSITFKELTEIILSIDSKEPETALVKGEILGMCSKKIAEKTNGD